MQRNWDIIRAILTRTAEKAPGQLMHSDEITGFDALEVNGQIAMLHDEGYLRASTVRGRSMVLSATVKALTKRGLDLADALKSPAVWASRFRQALP